MAKQTRKERALQLIDRIRRGPAFHNLGPNPDPPEYQYRLWMESWIEDEVIDLVPELRRGGRK